MILLSSIIKEFAESFLHQYNPLPSHKQALRVMEQCRKLQFSVHFRFLPHTIKTKRPRYPTLGSDRGALHGVPLSQRPSLHRLR